MFYYIKNLIEKFFTMDEEKQVISKNKNVSDSLKENLKYFKSEFSNSKDLTIRELKIASHPAAIVTIEGMVDKEVLATSVINPFLECSFPDKNSSDIERYLYIKDDVLSSSEQTETEDINTAFSLLMSGFALLLYDGVARVLAIGIQGFKIRAISEPISEVMQKGSREGFVESIKVNMTLIRRRIKNPKLKFDSMTVGSVSKTNICLCYLTDMVSDAVLDEIKKRLNNSNLKYVLAAEYLEPYLEESKTVSFFSSVGFSERPDTVCGKISEGRIAILVDGTPNAAIVPYLFVEYFQTLDDYALKPYFATLARWLKYIAFFIAALLPGIYVALGTFNPEVFPNELMSKIATAIGNTPFPLLLETLIIHFVYEIMREAGLRLPRPLGHAVSIVGALVIGETAVNSGLIGAPTLMVVALTAISSYVIPTLYEATAFIRLIFIIAGGTTGMIGIMLLFSIFTVNICSKVNYGVPFTTPIAPFGLNGMRDVAIRANWKTLAKNYKKIQDMPQN